MVVKVSGKGVDLVDFSFGGLVVWWSGDFFQLEVVVLVAAM